MKPEYKGKSAMSARAAAAQAVAKLIGAGSTIDAVLPGLLLKLRDPRDRGLARELSSGTARWYFELVVILNDLVERPVKDNVVRAVLLCGLYQLRHLRIADHAAISESVKTVRQLGRDRSSGLVNAVLRRYQREAERFTTQIEKNLSSHHAYPQWMVDAFKKDWPENYEQLLANGNERAPMWLRVNKRQTDVATWLALPEHTQPMTSSPHVDCALKPEAAIGVEELPGFHDGMVSVQDAGAQLAASLMTLEDGMRVLDACAAPGGKTCHMLESADIELTAVDNDAVRLERVEENLQRLKLRATVVKADVAETADWWDGKAFDRILLDVPCSATGVIRRHPDIKILRRASDIEGLAQRQLAMLRAAWPMLAPGGRLLYVTCSVLRAENADVVQAFVDSETSARSHSLNVKWGIKDGPGRQILTGEAGMDGFYYSCLESV